MYCYNKLYSLFLKYYLFLFKYFAAVWTQEKVLEVVNVLILYNVLT